MKCLPAALLIAIGGAACFIQQIKNQRK